MKKCPNCSQIFTDDNDFCLNDGRPLVAESGGYQSWVEMPTQYVQRPQNTPYPTTAVPAPHSNRWIFPLVGILCGLVVVLGFMVFIKESPAEKADDRNTKNTTQTTTSAANNGVGKTNSQNATVTSAPEKPVVTSMPKVEPVRPPGSRGGLVHRPPTNIRSSPGGAIQCVVKSRSTINIYGDTGVYDNNGLWYYTDVCGRQGVIHSSQFQFAK